MSKQNKPTIKFSLLHASFGIAYLSFKQWQLRKDTYNDWDRWCNFSDVFIFLHDLLDPGLQTRKRQQTVKYT